jgi:putative aminopeptidase FrvX
VSGPGGGTGLPGGRELELFRELVGIASPSGREGALAAKVREKIAACGFGAETDGAGNLTVRIAGREPGAGKMILAAHLDEISLVVTGIGYDGSLWVDRSGGLLPHKIGECPVEILGERGSVTGVLSMGSADREDAEEYVPRWSDARIITGLDQAALRAAGVRVGSAAVPAAFLRGPILFGEEADPLVAAWSFDDRGGVVALLRLLEEVREKGLQPRRPTLVCFTVHEEEGCHGAKVVAQRERPEIFIAVDGCPMPPGVELEIDGRPGVWSKDTVAHSDQGLVSSLCEAAEKAGTELQIAVYSAAASEASKVYEVGGAERVVTVGHVRENSHGYEVARLSVFHNLVATLAAFLEEFR